MELTAGMPDASSPIEPSARLMRTTPSRSAVQIMSPSGVKTKSSASPGNGGTATSTAPVLVSKTKMLSPMTLAM